MKKSDINVLVVDDDKAIGKTLSEAILRSGYKPVVATRADEAMNVIRIKDIHAAIIDCMLPVKNGVDLAVEIRKTGFEKRPIVLMSGIFKDRAFEAEALHRSNAIAYLQKPFGPSELLSILNPALEPLLEENVWSLQTILTKNLATTRDRVKIVEHLEEIKGVESAFVLSILLDSKVIGYLNLVSEDGGIFGVTLQNGLITAVDSDDCDELTIRYLIDTGFLAKVDWTEYSGGKKKAQLSGLVTAGYISPHAFSQAKKDQMIFDLKRILRARNVNVNFVPGPAKNSADDGIGLSDLFVDLNSTIDEALDLEYLKKFLNDHMNSGLRNLDSLNYESAVWSFPIVDRVRNIMKPVPDRQTLKEMIQDNSLLEPELLKAIYCLIICRQILFIDMEAKRKSDLEVQRRQKIFDAIRDKNPYQVFEYFGASAQARPKEIENIFREFVMANHPDKLPSDALLNLKEVTNLVFSTVSGAYDTLINPAKRQEYDHRIMSQAAEKEIRAESLALEALEMIRRGSYAAAEEKMNQAYNMSSSRKIYCMQLWARIKNRGKNLDKLHLVDYQRKLEEFPLNERNNPYFHMALGLIRASNNDNLAINSFEKALALDPNFVEARREANAIHATKESQTNSTDILTGDLTQIISQVFKKKTK